MKLRIENFATLLLTVILLLYGCAGCGPKTAEEVAPPVDETLPGGSLHREHPPNTAYTKVPEAPPGDAFFRTIQFPKTPPYRPDGHYRLPKSPFLPPDFVQKYPEHFSMDDKGFWHLREGSEKWQKIGMYFRDLDLPDEVNTQRFIALVGEGLDKVATGAYLMRLAGYTAEAKKLFEEVIAEDPDNFEALAYYCAMIQDKNPEEGEAILRRLVELRPDSILAQYNLACHLTYHHPEPREAIPYLEKVYQRNPWWYDPIFVLGITYYSLGEYEKALAYFEAAEVFTGPMRRLSLYKHLIREQPAMKRKNETQTSKCFALTDGS